MQRLQDQALRVWSQPLIVEDVEFRLDLTDAISRVMGRHQQSPDAANKLAFTHVRRHIWSNKNS